MHPCWKIPELLQEILDLCDRRDVLRMCLVCQTFTPAALDIVWRDLQDGIAPFLYCFPAGVVQKQVGEGRHEATFVCIAATFGLVRNES